MGEITNEDLARMVQQGFSDIDKRVTSEIGSVHKRLDEVENKIDNVQTTLLNHMDAEAVHRGQLEQRVSVIERQLGIAEKVPA